MKRVIFIAVWAVVVFVGGDMLLGYLSGLFFAAHAGQDDRGVGQLTLLMIGVSWALVPMIMGPLGLLPGLFGKLPGTRTRPKAADVAPRSGR